MKLELVVYMEDQHVLIAEVPDLGYMYAHKDTITKAVLATDSDPKSKTEASWETCITYHAVYYGTEECAWISGAGNYMLEMVKVYYYNCKKERSKKNKKNSFRK